MILHVSLYLHGVQCVEFSDLYTVTLVAISLVSQLETYLTSIVLWNVSPNDYTWENIFFWQLYSLCLPSWEL